MPPPPHAAPATPSSPVSLRVYGPEDYHVRLRRYFEEKGSLRLPAPGEIEEVPADDRGDGRIEGLMNRAASPRGSWASTLAAPSSS